MFEMSICSVPMCQTQSRVSVGFENIEKIFLNALKSTFIKIPLLKGQSVKAITLILI